MWMFVLAGALAADGPRRMASLELPTEEAERLVGACENNALDACTTLALAAEKAWARSALEAFDLGGAASMERHAQALAFHRRACDLGRRASCSWSQHTPDPGPCEASGAPCDHLAGPVRFGICEAQGADHPACGEADALVPPRPGLLMPFGLVTLDGWDAHGQDPVSHSRRMHSVVPSGSDAWTAGQGGLVRVTADAVTLVSPDGMSWAGDAGCTLVDRAVDGTRLLDLDQEPPEWEAAPDHAGQLASACAGRFAWATDVCEVTDAAGASVWSQELACDGIVLSHDGLHGIVRRQDRWSIVDLEAGTVRELDGFAGWMPGSTDWVQVGLEQVVVRSIDGPERLVVPSRRGAHVAFGPGLLHVDGLVYTLGDAVYAPVQPTLDPALVPEAPKPRAERPRPVAKGPTSVKVVDCTGAPVVGAVLKLPEALGPSDREGRIELSAPASLRSWNHGVLERDGQAVSFTRRPAVVPVLASACVLEVEVLTEADARAVAHLYRGSEVVEGVVRVESLVPREPSRDAIFLDGDVWSRASVRRSPNGRLGIEHVSLGARTLTFVDADGIGIAALEVRLETGGDGVTATTDLRGRVVVPDVDDLVVSYGPKWGHAVEDLAAPVVVVGPQGCGKRPRVKRSGKVVEGTEALPKGSRIVGVRAEGSEELRAADGLEELLVEVFPYPVAAVTSSGEEVWFDLHDCPPVARAAIEPVWAPVDTPWLVGERWYPRSWARAAAQDLEPYRDLSKEEQRALVLGVDDLRERYLIAQSLGHVPRRFATKSMGFIDDPSKTPKGMHMRQRNPVFVTRDVVVGAAQGGVMVYDRVVDVP